ncbi:MAG: glycoside hydrolase family 3 protein, partial [Mycobacteriales bacterium]
MLALTAGATMFTAGADANSPTYLDSSASAAIRAGDLLGRMTLAEKAGQMTQIRLGKLRGDCQWTPGPLQPNCMKDVLADHAAGSILSGGGDYPVPDNTPRAWAEMTNSIQKYAIENSRLHIPVVYGADGVHGHNNLLGATLFPQQLGLAATFDPALVTASTTSTRHAMLATGVHWDFAPVADLARDTRWGRYYETFGEDPYLAGTLDAAAVDGLQGDRNHPAMAATVKHFGAYSQPLNGHDRVPADVSVRYLQDTLLKPYQAEVDAGVLTAMANSGAVNGVPAHASKYLLTGQLRDRMGFGGVVVSDWQDVRNLVDAYHLAPDYEHAIAMSVNAGLDMAMEPSEAGDFQTNLIKAVHDGLISQHRIDQSVRRILTLKFRLGLFEHPYVDAAAANGLVYGADTDVARQAAAESAVLLKNSGSALPLAGTAKVVVTGPNADNGAAQLGGWSIGWQGVPAGVTPPAVTIRHAFDTETGGAAVYAPDQASAVAALKSADVAVAVIGETTPGAEGLNDSENPVVPADQQALVAALKATGKPVVVVMIASRPLVLGS